MKPDIATLQRLKEMLHLSRHSYEIYGDDTSLNMIRSFQKMYDDLLADFWREQGALLVKKRKQKRSKYPASVIYAGEQTLDMLFGLS